MPRHVLLMLSTKQPPDPQKELKWHADECARGGATAVITTRRPTRLTPGRSVVAFYGNVDLENRYLGRGTFVEYVPIGDLRARELLRDTPIYHTRGTPRGAQGFIVLRDVQLARPGEDLTALGGTIERSGLPLTLENVPRGAARVQVYFT